MSVSDTHEVGDENRPPCLNINIDGEVGPIETPEAWRRVGLCRRRKVDSGRHLCAMGSLPRCC